MCASLLVLRKTGLAMPGRLLLARGARIRPDWRAAVAVGVSFALYLCTLAPTIYNLDSAELTTAAATGGIVRATGYPLYLLLGRAWSLLPIGDVGYRMNLFSACNAALTVALAERILRRLGVGPWAALAALGLLAGAPFFWALSLIAEVYTLHTALMAGIVLALLRWSERPTAGRLAIVAFLVGASAGNHAATLLLVPGVAWYLWAGPRTALRPRALVWACGALLAGLSVYLYLPLRYAAAPAFNYAGHYRADGTFVAVNLYTIEGFWWLVSGSAFRGQMFSYGWEEMWGEVGRLCAQLWRAFFAVGIGPGLVGLLQRREWPVRGMLLLMFLGNVLFYTNYAAPDKETMFLPVYLVWALWVGLGCQALLDWLARDRDDRIRRWSTGLLRAGMVGAVLLAVAWTWHTVDLSRDWSTRTRGQEILDASAPGALVVGGWDTVPVVEYLQLVEGQRPDVQAINRFQISRGDMLALIEAQLGKRPIYVDATTGSLSGIATVEAASPLYRLLPRP